MVIHETLPDLEMSVHQVKPKVPDVVVAVACTEVSEFRRILGSESAQSVGLAPLNASIYMWLSILRLLLSGHAMFPPKCSVGRATARYPGATARPGTGMATKSA